MSLFGVADKYRTAQDFVRDADLDSMLRQHFATEIDCSKLVYQTVVSVPVGEHRERFEWVFVTSGLVRDERGFVQATITLNTKLVRDDVLAAANPATSTLEEQAKIAQKFVESMHHAGRSSGSHDSQGSGN
eukprot:ANDGO_04997.mRNA.1 hypothetical protein